MNLFWLLMAAVSGGLFLLGRVTYGIISSITTVIMYVIAKSQIMIDVKTYIGSMLAFLAIGAGGAEAWHYPPVQTWIISNVFPYLPEWTRNLLGIP